METALTIASGMPLLKKERQLRIHAFGPYVSLLPWFNVDVLHKLYINIYLDNIFEMVVSANDPELKAAIEKEDIRSYEIRAITCADFLQSPCLRRIDYNVFIMQKDIKEIYRKKIKEKTAVVEKIGRFMLAYTLECRGQFLGTRYREVFRLEGVTIIDPAKAARQITNHIAQQVNNSQSLYSQENTIGYYLDILNNHDIQPQHKELVKFMNGLQDWFQNKQEAAKKQFEELQQKSGGENTATIKMKLPKSVQENIIANIEKERLEKKEENLDISNLKTDESLPDKLFIFIKLDNDKKRNLSSFTDFSLQVFLRRNIKDDVYNKEISLENQTAKNLADLAKVLNNLTDQPFKEFYLHFTGRYINYQDWLNQEDLVSFLNHPKITACFFAGYQPNSFIQLVSSLSAPIIAGTFENKNSVDVNNGFFTEKFYEQLFSGSTFSDAANNASHQLLNLSESPTEKGILISGKAPIFLTSQKEIAEHNGFVIFGSKEDEERKLLSISSQNQGYNPNFFKNVFVSLPIIPTQLSEDIAKVTNTKDNILRYPHHSIILNAKRKFAFFSAANVAPSKFINVKRANKWIKDKRVDSSLAGNEFYSKSVFDRGHLTTRSEVCWGDSEQEAEAANESVNNFANALPIHGELNRETWRRLEQAINNFLGNQGIKGSVITGPVFLQDDPINRDIQIPLYIWKVLYFNSPSEGLSRIGFFASQYSLLVDEGLISGAKRMERTYLPENFEDNRVYQVPIPFLEDLSNLTFSPAKDVSNLELFSEFEKLGFDISSEESAPPNTRTPTQKLADLKKQLDRDIPAKRLNDKLLIASWNIKEFGGHRYGGRTEEALSYIATIIERFDIIAIQEINNPEVLDKIKDRLGENWDYFCGNQAPGAMGSRIHLGYFYDKRKVDQSGTLGDLNVPPRFVEHQEGVETDERVFARPPFNCGFTFNDNRFVLCNVHLYYGRAPQPNPRRIQELKTLLNYWQHQLGQKNNWSTNTLLLGTFHGHELEDQEYELIRESIFDLAPSLLIPSNARRDKFYNQIIFHLKAAEKNFGETGGAFDFFESVFRLEEQKDYENLMGEKYIFDKDGKPANQKSKDRHYNNFWRTYQMSDNLPLWIELSASDLAETSQKEPSTIIDEPSEKHIVNEGSDPTIDLDLIRDKQGKKIGDQEELYENTITLVEKNKFKEALDLLGRNLIDQAAQDEINLLNQRLNELIKNERTGLIQFEDAEVENAKILYAILSIIRELDHKKVVITTSRISSEEIEKIKKEIAKNDLEKAISMLEKHEINSEYQMDIISFKSRFNRLKRQQLLQIISRENGDIKMNQLKFGVLDLLDLIAREGH